MANQSNPNNNTTMAAPATSLPAVRPRRQYLHLFGRERELARYRADYEHRDYEAARIASRCGHESHYTPAALAALPKEHRLLIKRWPADWEAQLRAADCVFPLPAAGGLSRQLLRMLAIAARFVGVLEFKAILVGQFGPELAGGREMEKREVKAVAVKAAGLGWAEVARMGLRE